MYKLYTKRSITSQLAISLKAAFKILGKISRLVMVPALLKLGFLLQIFLCLQLLPTLVPVAMANVNLNGNDSGTGNGTGTGNGNGNGNTTVTVQDASMKASTNAKTDANTKAEPLQITADSAEFDDTKGTAIYKGQVVAIQGYRNLWADSLIIKRGTNDKIDSVIAYGSPAKIKSKPQANKADGFGYANTIKYYPELDKVELIGNAILEQNGDIIKGEFLTYFFDDKRLISNKTKNSRTTVIIQPRKKT